jgi:hypothetical protein
MGAVKETNKDRDWAIQSLVGQGWDCEAVRLGCLVGCSQHDNNLITYIEQIETETYIIPLCFF